MIAGSTTHLISTPTTPQSGDTFRSFEVYSRTTIEPEIITFDELCAPARWIVELLGGDV